MVRRYQQASDGSSGIHGKGFWKHQGDGAFAGGDVDKATLFGRLFDREHDLNDMLRKARHWRVVAGFRAAHEPFPKTETPTVAIEAMGVFSFESQVAGLSGGTRLMFPSARLACAMPDGTAEIISTMHRVWVWNANRSFCAVNFKPWGRAAPRYQN